MSKFILQSKFKPTGDQPKAIKSLTEGILAGEKHQTLLGVTGSGKTFTIASVINNVQKPTLVMSHNKTLAWQLYQEFKEFFPKNAVEYFVSYYDYYQPEAYIPQSNTYIEKDARINEKIDKMRHSTIQKLITRKDVIVVASVSCIYGLGAPETYKKVSLQLVEEQKMSRKELLRALISLGYTRNDIDPRAGNMRVRGEKVEIFPATGENATVVELSSGHINLLQTSNNKLTTVQIFPAHLWITEEDNLPIIIANIRAELSGRLKELGKENKLVEAQRLEQRTHYDLELLAETGWVPGIENYSRHLDFREAGEPGHTLLDYFKMASDDFLTIIDESHMTIPQLRSMYAGDKARKDMLIQYGFRLPSAYDNRPLMFDETEKKINQRIYLSATPGEYELEKDHVVEQLIRPTGLTDPTIEIRPTKNQMKSAIAEIEERIKNKQRVFVITLTKRLAEDVSEYLAEHGISVQYLHSDIKTLERPKILHDLRKGKYDVIVGINLLREGLDIPEVGLVIIFDADKEGFLRNETTLIQTIGRAARHKEGHVIMYADKNTGSMKRAIQETDRRRAIQEKYNADNNITPQSIHKEIPDLPDDLFLKDDTKDMSEFDALTYKEIERQMKIASKNMDYERAAKLRDQLKKIKGI